MGLTKKRSVFDRAKDEFANVAAAHELSVVRDDGVWRHLHFRNPGTMVGWYTLVTWPGVLCINGDYGTYVFTRIKDMFAFFRSPDGRINPSYWGEKVVASDRHDGLTEWSPERFTGAVVSNFRSWWYDRDRSERRECFRRLREDVLQNADEEWAATNAAYAFSYRGYTLEGLYEYRLTEYTFRFIWCLHAIVRGIQMYDAMKAGAQSASSSVPHTLGGQ